MRWKRTPIPWELYRVVADPPALQIVYARLGSGDQPGAAIAEVNVAEHASSVRIELVERELTGTLPPRR